MFSVTTVLLRLFHMYMRPFWLIVFVCFLYVLWRKRYQNLDLFGDVCAESSPIARSFSICFLSLIIMVILGASGAERRFLLPCFNSHEA